MAYVYFIESSKGATYIGATVNLDKRIRQHNKEISGGAVATSNKVIQGEAWSYYCYVENFPSYNEALKFEWRWKQLSREIKKKTPTIKPREKRMEALTQLLNMERPTSKAMPYSEWETPPKIVYI